MKNGQESIVNFKIDILQNISITHGYNITNSFPVHFHTSYNLGLIESGERDILYRGNKYKLSQNDIFVIQPFEPHCCVSEEKLGHNYKIISFNTNKALYFPYLIINDKFLPELLLEFHKIAEYEKGSPKLKTLFKDILGLLNENYSASQTDTDNKAHQEKIIIAKQYIENKSHQELTLKEMADVACLSEYHFNRHFHQLYGLSPYAYYLVCKMKIAQKILMTEQSVTETTYKTGCFDQSHFTRLFKKHIGVTPGRYLKDNRP